MKSPNLNTLVKAKPTDPVTAAIEKVEGPGPVRPRTFSLDKITMDRMQQLALALGQKHGSVITLSEALRLHFQELDL